MSERTLRTSIQSVHRKIFGPKLEKLSGNGRKLHEEEFHEFYSSSNIVAVIK
jgi:hypothetical protein